MVSGFGVVKPACGADDGSEHCLSSASVVLYGIAVLGYVGGCCVSEKNPPQLKYIVHNDVR